MRTLLSGVAKEGGGGAGGAVRLWRDIYGGGTMGYAVGYKPVEAASGCNIGTILAVDGRFWFWVI